MQIKLAPSLMCANALTLGQDIAALERAGADLLHIDVMDGHFVPNLALSLDLAEQVANTTRAPIDVHLMVERPGDYLERLSAIGAAYVSFHIEATNNPIRVARAFRARDIQVGIALNPATPADAIWAMLDEIDFALLMTVEPGFAGQKFLPQVLGKIAAVRRMLDVAHPATPIEVDGNLTLDRTRECIAAGASIIVAGTSSIFRDGVDLYAATADFRAQIGAGNPASTQMRGAV